MKRIIYLNLLIILLVMITGCRDNNMYDKEDITMTIKNGTLTNKGATIIIIDSSKKNNSYGLWFRIDKKENNKWKKLKTKGNWINMPSYYVDENNKLELEHNWESIYGNLQKGEYRIIKEVNDKYISVEFIIS